MRLWAGGGPARTEVAREVQRARPSHLVGETVWGWSGAGAGGAQPHLPGSVGQRSLSVAVSTGGRPPALPAAHAGVVSGAPAAGRARGARRSVASPVAGDPAVRPR